MSTVRLDRWTALPSVLQKQILSQPGTSNIEVLAALVCVSKPLGPLCEPYYKQPLVVVLRSADQAESFALWVAKHGRHIPILTITADGEWISNTHDNNIPADGRGFAAWAKIWHNLVSAQTPAPQLQHVAIHRTFASSKDFSASPSDRNTMTSPLSFLSVPVSALSLLPGRGLTSLNLSTPEPGRAYYDPNGFARPLLSRGAVPLLSSLQGLQQLHLTIDNQVLRSITPVTTLSSSLTKLVLDASIFGYDPAAVCVVTALTSLRDLSLSLGRFPESEFGVGISALSSLTRLYLGLPTVTEVEHAGLAEVEDGMPGLIHLTALQQLAVIGHAVVVSDQLPFLTQLERFYYDLGGHDQHCFIPEELIPVTAIASMHNLTELVWNCTNMADELLPALQQMSKLQTLKLAGIDTSGERDSPLILTGDLSGFTGLSSLKSLSLHWFNMQHADAVLPALCMLTSLTQLQELALMGCYFSETHVAAVAANLTGLTRLSLEPPMYSEGVEPAALCMLTLLTGLQELELLGLEGAQALVDNGYYSRMEGTHVKVGQNPWPMMVTSTASDLVFM